MGTVESVNVGAREASAAKSGASGINKRPVDRAVAVRAPGPREGGLGSGLVGDVVVDTENHGGDNQAVYAYAREDYDFWAGELGRPLAGGQFGENLTTAGIDVSGAVIGERWRVGPDLLLQTTFARIPCLTFQTHLDEPQWIKRFTAQARPGAYLRVVEPGEVRAGDPIDVVHRPAHGVTIAEGFRAWTLEPELLPRLLTADEAPASLLDKVRARLDRTAPPPN